MLSGYLLELIYELKQLAPSLEQEIDYLIVNTATLTPEAFEATREKLCVDWDLAEDFNEEIQNRINALLFCIRLRMLLQIPTEEIPKNIGSFERELQAFIGLDFFNYPAETRLSLLIELQKKDPEFISFLEHHRLTSITRIFLISAIEGRWELLQKLTNSELGNRFILDLSFVAAATHHDPFAMQATALMKEYSHVRESQRSPPESFLEILLQLASASTSPSRNPTPHEEQRAASAPLPFIPPSVIEGHLLDLLEERCSQPSTAPHTPPNRMRPISP